MTDNGPEVVWEVKKKTKNFLPPNESVLSNIYGTKRKQGQMQTFTDMVISCCRHMIQARAGAKESQPLCLEEVLISQWPGDLFKRATGWISTCVQKLEPRSVSKKPNYTRFLCNTIFSSIDMLSLHLHCQLNKFIWPICDHRGRTPSKLKPAVNTGFHLDVSVAQVISGEITKKTPWRGRGVYMKPDHFRELFTKQQVPL